MTRTLGSHHSARAITTTWLTPLPIIDALGGAESFDLDPCAAPLPRPWATARRMNAAADADGLAIDWEGRIWLNPPYSSAEISRWLRRLADHNRGTALIFARTETQTFVEQVWERATGLLFLHGRLHFHRPIAPAPWVCDVEPHDWEEYAPNAFACRNCGAAKANSGAPSVLCAYGNDDLDRLAASALAGTLVPLRFPRGILVAGLPDVSWAQAMRDWLARQTGPVSVSDAYRYFSGHPKAAGNDNWRAKVRQKIAQIGERVARDQYIAVAVAA